MELWITFVLASTIILVVPGPTIILVISQAAANGRGAAMPLVAGVVMGDFLAMTLSLLGLGALMTTSAALFSLIKWAGAAYLVYLGIRLWLSGPEGRKMTAKADIASPLGLLRNAFVVTALNPKSIAFFVAFLPQFVDPARPATFQLVELGATFLVLAALNALAYALLAGRLGEYIQKSKVRKWLKRLGGGALIGAGIVTAGIRQGN